MAGDTVKECTIRISPFAGWRYNPKVVGDPAACVSPPYDQFTPSLIERLERQCEFNVAHVVKAPTGASPDPTGARYTEAHQYLDDWIAREALTPDPSPGFYPYSQEYEISGQRLTRRGFIALGDLRDASILPHEETHAHIREDRARLRMETAADFGLIFVVYSDPTQTVDRILRDCESSDPLATAGQPDGSRHTLYRCANPDTIATVTRQIAGLDCVIADGHHRTAAAFDAWQRTKDDRWAYTLMAFFNADAPGMTVLPIHRAVSLVGRSTWESNIDRLARFFDVKHIPHSLDNIPETVAYAQSLVAERDAAGHMAFAVMGASTKELALIEEPKESADDWPWPDGSHSESRSLPTARFETGVLRGALHFEEHQIDSSERIAYFKDAVDCVQAVRDGGYQLAFLLPATPFDDIFRMAKVGQKLPRKSTYFYPKLLTGLVVNRIETLAS